MVKLFPALALLSLLAPLARGEGDHADHAEVFEWGGLFDVKDYNKVFWLAQKVDGGYADETMKIAIITADGDGHEHLEAAETKFETSLETTWENNGCQETTTSSEDMTPSDSVCYKLDFDVTIFESIYTINVTGVNYIAFFAEHVPTEFESTTHYLLTADGDSVEPLHELPESHDDDAEEKKWAEVLIACLIVNLATFCGVVLLACNVNPSKISPGVLALLLGGAAGALIACAIFLIIGEANHIMGAAFPKDEAAATWRWGTAVIAGIIVPYVFVAINPMSTNKEEEEQGLEMTSKVVSVDEESDTVTTAGKKSWQQSLIFAITVGDFAHNLTDGFVLGVAFKLCSSSVAWGIFGATLYHEIAQELSDFVMLTTEAGLSVTYALAINFLAGTSIIIGGAIATEIDMGRQSTASILAFGGGTYLYLGLSEALPFAFNLADKASDSVKVHYLKVLGAFALGAIAIGLVLIDHEHCTGGDDDGDDAHAGHGHRF